MGQGQTKASKRRETNGEQGPSPKKEAKKSPKKSKSSKSPRTSRTPSMESPTKGHMQIEERERSPQRIQGRRSQSPSTKAQDIPVNGRDIVNEEISDVKQVHRVGSPPKPKRTYEVDFVEPEKENVPVDELDSLDVSDIRKTDSSPNKTPVKMNGLDSQVFTPTRTSGLNQAPQATSTPAPNGILTTGRGRHSSGPCSDDDHTDVSDDEAYASEQQDSWYEKRGEVNYGKFYNQSYLKSGSQNYIHRGARTASEPKVKNNVNQFIRPANFSYSKEPPSFLKPKKGGMMSLAQGSTTSSTTVKSRRSSSPGASTTAVAPPTTPKVQGIRKNSEAIKMSMYPGGKPPPPRELAKIEREDWPAPPSPAAILPEILRQRRKSRGEEDEDEDEAVFEDPKIKREIVELKKIKDESGIGKVIYNELEEAKAAPAKPLDPWKSSRVPNAAYEPKYQTRYQSPMFASPSRFIDRSRRSWDDSDIRGYRTMSILGNFPTPKPGYGLEARAATMPVSGIYGGPLDLPVDYRVYDIEMAGVTREHHISSSSINTETSKVTSTIFDQPGVSLMTFQKSSWHTESAPPEYPYERLKISNFDLPKDVDRNMLEIHLPKEDFESIFSMTAEEFRHLPEWKRNDMKRKKDLY